MQIYVPLQQLGLPLGKDYFRVVKKCRIMETLINNFVSEHLATFVFACIVFLAIFAVALLPSTVILLKIINLHISIS